MKKYYIEIFDDSGDYIFQSAWFKSEQKAIDWANKITYLGGKYNAGLMSAEWDRENDTYTDIDFERVIRIGVKL